MIGVLKFTNQLLWQGSSVLSSIYQGIAQKTYKTLNMGRSQSAPKK